jgi:hypothetical protein
MFACSENAAADLLAELLRRTSARTGNQLGGIQGAQVETNAAVSVPGLDVAMAGFLDQLRRSTETNEVRFRNLRVKELWPLAR